MLDRRDPINYVDKEPVPAHIATAPPVAHAALLGLGVYRPRRVVPNSELVDQIDSTDEWIRSRSGIESRRWAGADETIVSMSVAAAADALAASGLAADQIDAVVLATSSQMVLGPSAGAVVATELGMHDTAAYDISAGCAGFCYALGNAAGLVRAGQARHVLVIGVERLSDLLDPPTGPARSSLPMAQVRLWWAHRTQRVSVRPHGVPMEVKPMRSSRTKTFKSTSLRSRLPRTVVQQRSVRISA